MIESIEQISTFATWFVALSLVLYTLYLNLHALLLVFLALQTQTFQSAKLQLAALVHLALVDCLVSNELAAALFAWSFPILLLNGMIRSGSHAAERLPPVMNGVDKFSDELSLYKLKDLTVWYILQRFYVGTVSEINAGLIHRLHYCVIDFILDGGVKAEDQKAALKILNEGFSEVSLETEYKAIEDEEEQASIFNTSVKKEATKQEDAAPQAVGSDA